MPTKEDMKEDVSDLLREFDIELKDWSNKLHGPATIIRNNKELKVKWLSKLVYKLRCRKKYQDKNISIRKEGAIDKIKLDKQLAYKKRVQEFLSNFDITLINGGEKWNSPVTIRLKDGEEKHISRVYKVIERLKKKGTYYSRGYNTRLSLPLRTEFTVIDSDTMYCNIHQISFKINANSRKKLCPECRKESFIKKAKEFCINAEPKDFIFDENQRRNKIKSQCLICKETFIKSWEEVIKTREIRCRSCKSHLNAIERHKFFYNYEQYADYTRKLTELNKIKYSNLIGERKSEDMHLDHKFSIYYAYKNHIPPWMCAAPSNLEYLPAHDNLLKQRYSSVSLSDFLVSFSDFIKVHPEYLEMVKSIEDTEEVPGGTKEVLEVTNSD